MLVQLMMILVAVVILGMVVVSLALRIPRLDVANKTSREDKLRAIDTWFSRLHTSGKFNGVVLLAKTDEILLCESYGHLGPHRLHDPRRQSEAWDRCGHPV